MLFILNVAPLFVLHPLPPQALFGLAVFSGVLNISKIKQFLDIAKSISISQLIKNKSKDLQHLLNYFNGTTISVSYLLELQSNECMCGSSDVLCFWLLWLCAIHSSFAWYDEGVICGCHANKADCQWPRSLSGLIK